MYICIDTYMRLYTVNKCHVDKFCTLYTYVYVYERIAPECLSAKLNDAYIHIVSTYSAQLPTHIYIRIYTY